MTLADLVRAIPQFHNMTGPDKTLIVGWYLSAIEGRSTFTGADLRVAFRSIHVEPPDFSVYLPRLADKRPPQLVKERSGYRLAGDVRRQFDAKYLERGPSVVVSALLRELPSKIPSLSERTFLEEALKCYRVEAYRAAIVMVWNLAFDHVRSWIVGDAARLAKFNLALGTKFPKKNLTIVSADDFQELTEAEVVEVCRTARIVTKDQTEILREKLKRRNSAAHPSNVTFTQLQADEMVTDLVNNIVLSLV